MINRYYQILGISNNATAHEIKSAFRKKAQILHPDHNASPNAQNEFIELNEACCYLLKSLEYNNCSDNRFNEYIKEQTDFAKEESRKYAKKKYEEYIKSNYYQQLAKITTWGDLIFATLVFLLILIFLRIIFFSSFFEFSAINLILSSFIPGVATAYMMQFIDLSQISKLNADLNKYQWIFVGGTISFNVFGFFYLGIKLFIPTIYIILLYCIPIVLFYLACRFRFKRKKSIKQIIYPITYGILPVTFLLLFNSSGVENENVRYYNVSKSWRESYSPIIKYENNELDKYWILRISITGHSEKKLANKTILKTSSGKLGIPYVTFYSTKSDRNSTKKSSKTY